MYYVPVFRLYLTQRDTSYPCLVSSELAERLLHRFISEYQLQGHLSVQLTDYVQLIQGLLCGLSAGCKIVAQRPRAVTGFVFRTSPKRGYRGPITRGVTTSAVVKLGLAAMSLSVKGSEGGDR